MCAYVCYKELEVLKLSNILYKYTHIKNKIDYNLDSNLKGALNRINLANMVVSILICVYIYSSEKNIIHKEKLFLKT